MDEALRNKIEAVLFSIGGKIHIDEILRMIKEKDKGKVVACLIELKKKYNDDPNGSLQILQDGDEWKLTIKDQYIDVAKEIGIETELSKTVMETLAVIAYKNPCLQSEIIRIRTNKAYDHLIELEKLGYILREKTGRTKKIKLTPKFFEYFDLPPEALKDKFKNVQEMENAIKEKELQIHEINQKKKEMLDEQKIQEKEMEKKNIFMEGSGIVKEVMEHDKSGMDIIAGEMLGNLNVYDDENAAKEDTQGAEGEKKDELMESSSEELLEGIKDIQESEKELEPVLNPELSEDQKNYDQKKEAENQSTQDLEEDLKKMQELKDKLNQHDKKEDSDVNAKGNVDVNEKADVAKNNEEKEDNIKSKDLGADDASKHKKHSKKHSDDGEDDLNKQKNEDNDHEEDYNDNIKNKGNKRDSSKDEEEDLEQKEQDQEVPNVENESDENDEDETFEKEQVKLQESKLFSMEGIPKEIMKKIEEKSEEITGEKKEKKERLI